MKTITALIATLALLAPVAAEAGVCRTPKRGPRPTCSIPQTTPPQPGALINR